MSERTWLEKLAVKAPRRSQEESVALAKAGRPYLIVHPLNRFDLDVLAIEALGVAVVESPYIPAGVDH